MYGRKKNRVKSVLFIPKTGKPDGPLRSDSGTALSSEQDESVVYRPVRHVNNVCLCYTNPSDCTTCTDDESIRSDQIFVLDELEPEMRLRGGSSPACSSSDGSSLFEDPFLENFEHNMLLNEAIESSGSLDSFLDGSSLNPRSLPGSAGGQTNGKPTLDRKTGSVFRKIPEIRKLVARETIEMGEFLAEKTCEFGKMIAMHGFQKALLVDDLEVLAERIEENQSIIEQKMNRIDDETVELDIVRWWMAKCKKEHAEARKEFLYRLIDEDVMRTNVLRIEELRAEMEKCRKADRDPEVDTRVELKAILDDVSTCQSFCYSDLG